MNILLIVLHKSYGDLLYNALLFKALKNYNKNISIEVLTTKQGLELYQKNPYIDFMSDNYKDFHKTYDILIDTTSKGLSYFMSFRLRAKEKITMIKKPRERFLKVIYNTLIEFEPKQNEIKNTLQIIYPITNTLDEVPYFWLFKENPFKNSSYVLISPTAPVKTKVIDIKIFNELARYIKAKGYDVIFSYPSSEAFYITQKLDFAHYISSDIHTFASILKDAKALISCETFSYHLAGFLNVPSVVLLGAYPMWKISDLQHPVSLNLNCQYCGSKTCHTKDMACLDIKMENIIPKLENLL